VKARLAEVLCKFLEEILQVYPEELWKCMLYRVAAVIDAKGWYTWY